MKHHHIKINYQDFTVISCPSCGMSRDIYDNQDQQITNFVVAHTLSCDVTSFMVRQWVESEVVE